MDCTSRIRNIVSGAFTSVLAKHSKSFSLIDCIAVGVDRMQRNRYRPAAASIIVVCLTLGNVFYSRGRFLSPYCPLHELVVPKRASTAFLLIPGITITPHTFLKATAVARRLPKVKVS